MQQNFSLIDNVNFISIHTKDVLRNHCGSVCNQELFDELEAICREHVNNKVNKYLQNYEKNKSEAAKAETLIGRICHYYGYATHKQSLKMRFTKKELEEGLSRLSEVEQKKVMQWLTDNGGYDKFIFQQWGNNE